MTEADWMASNDPTAMLTFVSKVGNRRKLRLWAVQCARRVWAHYSPGAEWPHRAIVAGEAYADGLLSGADLRAVEMGIGFVGSISAKAAAYDVARAVVAAAADKAALAATVRGIISA